MDRKELIIDKPEALRKRHRFTNLSLTLLFWIAFVYLWQPLISLIAWSFGFKLFYEHMVLLGGADGFIQMISNYTLAVFLLGGSLILWALYNKFRFRNKLRRAGSDRLTSKEVAEYFKLQEHQHQLLKNQRNITIAISDDFEITCKVNK